MSILSLRDEYLFTVLIVVQFISDKITLANRVALSASSCTFIKWLYADSYLWRKTQDTNKREGAWSLTE